MTDDIDALVAALAKTTLGSGINEKELLKLLRPSSSSKAGDKASKDKEGARGEGGAASGAAASGASSSSAARATSQEAPSPKPRKPALGPAELLKNLLAASAPDAEAAATGTVRLLQSLDEDDDEALSSYEEDYESDGESSSRSALASASMSSTSSADFSSDAVGPRLRAELGTLVLKAFDTAAGMTASSFPDAAKAASRGRLTRESLAALLARGGGSARDAAAVDDPLLRFGLRDGSSGELYLGYAGFLKLLASEVADLRAVLRYAALEVPVAAAVGEAEAAATTADAAAEEEAAKASSSSATTATVAAPPASSPALSSADLTFQPGTVSLIFGGVRSFFVLFLS